MISDNKRNIIKQELLEKLTNVVEDVEMVEDSKGGQNVDQPIVGTQALVRLSKIWCTLSPKVQKKFAQYQTTGMAFLEQKTD